MMGSIDRLSNAPRVRNLREAAPTAAEVPITPAPATEQTAINRLFFSPVPYFPEVNSFLYQLRVKPTHSALDLASLKE